MTELDLGRIEVTEWVINEIPRVMRGDDPTLTPSEVASPYDADVARFFERKISESLRKSQHSVRPNDEDPARAPAKITSHLNAGDPPLVALATDLANRLVAVQTGAMSGGLLVTIRGAYADSLLVATLKLEREEGARAAAGNVGGKSTYSVQYMRDLFLTGRTRVFKVALFRIGERLQLQGWVSDPQGRARDVADFFLHDFLGCDYERDPAETTRDFHKRAEEFINDKVDNPEFKARYENALLTELQRDSPELKVEKFAREHLDARHRQAFAAHMREAQVPPSFVKDLKLIAGRIRRLQFSFENGAKINAPADLPPEVMSVEGLGDGRTRVAVTDVLKELGSRA